MIMALPNQRPNQSSFLIFSLISYFKEQEKILKRTIFGYILENTGPLRWKSSKHFVSREEYRSNKYPTYASGISYAITGE